MVAKKRMVLHLRPGSQCCRAGTDAFDEIRVVAVAHQDEDHVEGEALLVHTSTARSLLY